MGQYEELKNKTKNIETPDNKWFLRNVEKISKELCESKENPKLPEFVFKEHFLDFFANYHKQEPGSKNSNEALYAKWLELAGSEYGKVDIIDNTGKTLFTTPGLLAKLKINYEHTKETNLEQLAKDATMRFNRTGAESINFVNKKLAQVESNLIKEPSHKEGLTWAAIVAMYKRQEKKENDITNADNPLTKGTKKDRKIGRAKLEDLGLNQD